MHRSGAQSSFFIRTVNNSRQTTCELPKQPLTIEPARVEISNYAFDKISVVQLTLRNQSRLPKKFKVVQPSKSFFSVKYTDKEIPGKESAEIYVCFNPQRQKVIIEDELIIKVEGDSINLYVPIVCYPKSFMGRNQSRARLSNRQNEQQSARKGRRPSVHLKRMATKHSSVFRSIEEPLEIVEKDGQNQVFLAFQQKFRRICDYVRQKYVKNEVYLGAKALTRQKQQQIKNYKKQVMKVQQQRLFLEVTRRYQTEYKSEGPIATTLLECSITWNALRNTPGITFQRGMNKIQQEIKKYVNSLRFQKIQNSLRFYQDYKKKEEKQGRKFKIQDYVEYHSCRMNQNKIGLDYDLQFDRSSVKPKSLPIEPEFKEFHGRFEGTERVDFDNWVPMNCIRPGSWELYQQKQIQIPDFFLHHPILLNDYRKGASQELHYLQANSTLKDQTSTLTSFLDGIPEQQNEEVFQFSLQMVKPDHRHFYATTEGEEQQLNQEQEFMKLGPLNSSRWRKRNTSIDMFGIAKNGDN